MVIDTLSSPAEEKKASILVVDDIPEIADEIAMILSQHGYEATATTPDQAHRVVHQNSTRVDVLLTDIRFVGRPGGIDNGLELAARLSENFGGLVFMTRSIGREALGHLTGQGSLPDGRNVFRGAPKGREHIRHLLAQVRGAIRESDTVSADERKKHLQDINLPQFNSGELTEELENIVAVVVEKLTVYAQYIRDMVARLKEKHGLEEWESWQQYKNVFETQIDFLETCNAKKVCGKSNKDTMEALHELRSRIILLDPNRIIPPSSSNSEVQKLLRTTQGHHAIIQKIIQKAYQDGENICHPQFDINRDVARIVGKNGVGMEDVVYYSDKLRGKSKFRDTNRLITSFFEALGKTFNGDGCKLSVRRIDENGLLWDDRPLQKKLQESMNWGGGYEIWVDIRGEKHLGKTYEQVLNPMLGTLQKLLAAKKIYINPKSFSLVVDSEYGGNRIEFFLKTEELDREMLAQKQAQKAKIQSKQIGLMKIPGSYGADKIEVTKVTTPSGTITVLGVHNPEKMGQLGGDWSVLKVGDEIILAKIGGSMSGGHAQNDEGICHYLFKRLGMNLREAYETAQMSIRLKLQEGCFLVDHEKSTDMTMEEIDQLCADMGRPNRYRMTEETLPIMTQIVKELGVENVILSRDSFYGRNQLYWMSVEILEDPLYINSKDEDMKDEWFE